MSASAENFVDYDFDYTEMASLLFNDNIDALFSTTNNIDVNTIAEEVDHLKQSLSGNSSDTTDANCQQNENQWPNSYNVLGSDVSNLVSNVTPSDGQTFRNLPQQSNRYGPIQGVNNLYNYYPKLDMNNEPTVAYEYNQPDQYVTPQPSQNTQVLAINKSLTDFGKTVAVRVAVIHYNSLQRRSITAFGDTAGRSQHGGL